MLDLQKIIRAQGLVALLVVVGLGTFFLVYTALGSAPQATRLFASLCTPPLVIAVVLGFLVLYVRTRNTE